MRPSLFAPAAEQLIRAANARELASLEPPPGQLPGLLQSLING